jgi:hypothetical protein
MNGRAKQISRAVLVAHAAALSATLAPGAAAYAGDSFNLPIVRAWGSSSLIQPPADLGPVVLIKAGDNFACAQRPDGTLRAWGQNLYGQNTVPATIGAVVEYAIGGNHGVARRADGSVACWGRNTDGQATPPAGLAATKIGTAYYASYAINTDGQVVCWGSNFYGQCTIPTTLGSVTQISGGERHTMALRTDGSVVCWGTNNAGQCNVPATLGTVTAIAAGGLHSIALRPNGTVACWGRNTEGQCTIPTGLTNVVEIAGGGLHTVARQGIGYAIGWGNGNLPGTTLSPAATIGAGLFSSFTINEGDCDGNGVLDTTEIAGNDCNNNGRHDTCEALFDVLEDCNNNGLGDACEQQLTVDVQSPVLTPFGSGAPVSWTVPNAAPAAASLRIKVRALADLGEPLETARLFMDGFDLGPVLDTAPNCLLSGWQSVWISIPLFNLALEDDGEVEFRLVASVAVDGGACPTGSTVEFDLDYTAATAADCNANGLLDVCEIAAGYATDANRNGVIDACEKGFGGCAADLDGDGEVGASDLSRMLDDWGDAPKGSNADLDGDGAVGAPDLSLLLAAWGVCG